MDLSKPLFSFDADNGAPEPVNETPSAPAQGNADVAALQARLAAREAELAAAQSQYESLNRNWEAAKSLLSPDNTDPDSVESAFRTAMSGAGYNRDEIEQQINAYRASMGPSGSEESDEGGQADDETRQYMEQLALNQQKLAQETSQARRTQLETLMGSSIGMAVDGSKDLNTLISKLATLDGGDPNESKESRRSILAGEIRNEATRLLREQRSATGGQWSDNWIPSATQKAAEIVYKKYRTVIGDPSRIGRVTETDAGEFLSTRAPVKPPEYRKGMAMDDAGKSVRDFAVDTLLRGVVSSSNAI
jgi:hypothetical protein